MMAEIQRFGISGSHLLMPPSTGCIKKYKQFQHFPVHSTYGKNKTHRNYPQMSETPNFAIYFSLCSQCLLMTDIHDALLP